jgi:hypothetical protein
MHDIWRSGAGLVETLCRSEPESQIDAILRDGTKERARSRGSAEPQPARLPEPEPDEPPRGQVAPATPAILHPYPDERFHVRTRGRSPVR